MQEVYIVMPKTRRILRLSAGVLALFSLAVFAADTGRQAAAAAACDPPDLTFDAEEQAFVWLINSYRAQYGLAPLTVSVNLNRAASWMAADLATRSDFSHTDSLGRSPFDRLADCTGSSYGGENLAAGSPLATAQDAFDLWRSSPSHDLNMLTAPFTQLGIARVYNPNSLYGWYWALEFGVYDDGTRLETVAY
ncbi:MAG TPA: CAP domain-containing protein [Dehalococcoidia bacterium]|nr:CAP domain-containing protein [Dehalococcoidia bacterium]